MTDGSRDISEAHEVQHLIEYLHDKYQTFTDGELATYIPELAKANPNHFGISLVTAEGRIFETGDCQQPFTIQSISKPFTFAMGEIDGVEVMVDRTGYTGEDGCELLCMTEDAVALWDAVVERGAKPSGLGARDTLRLEVCYPLHGNDITPETDAISAGLGWVCALDKDFTGAEELRRIKEEGPQRKLAAFVMTDKAIPRHGMPIEGGGEVTSGTHSPMLDAGIGLGYVPAAAASPDSEITIDVRGKPRRAKIVKKPIYKREER